MKTLAIVLQSLLLLTLGSFAEEADSHDKAAGDILVLITKLGTTLQEVKDVASAEKAKENLDNLLPEFQKWGERIKKLGKPTSEVDATLKEKYGKQMHDAMKAFLGELKRVNNETKESIDVIKESLDAISQAMMASKQPEPTPP